MSGQALSGSTWLFANRALEIVHHFTGQLFGQKQAMKNQNWGNQHENRGKSWGKQEIKQYELNFGENWGSHESTWTCHKKWLQWGKQFKRTQYLAGNSMFIWRMIFRRNVTWISWIATKGCSSWLDLVSALSSWYTMAPAVELAFRNAFFQWLN